MRRLFALDQNFPEPIIKVMADSIECAELVPVRQIDPRLTRVDDWELLFALHANERKWDGLITSDDSMLNLEREICFLLQTKLTLVVARGQGHNPVRATGIVLAHIENICHQTKRDVAQIWDLSVVQKPWSKPWESLRKIAERRGTTPDKLFQANRIDGIGKAET